jgi:hypothetical protein
MLRRRVGNADRQAAVIRAISKRAMASEAVTMPPSTSLKMLNVS